MTLKDKFYKLFIYNIDIYPLDETVKIAEDFAIGFGEFMLTKVFVKKSVKELLEIYKKEKGL